MLICPAGTVALFWFVTTPIVSPAPVRAAVAALSLRPTTLGTMTGGAVGGPEDTTRLTAEPEATEAPAAGFWPMTLPAGTVALACRAVSYTHLDVYKRQGRAV